MKALLINPPTGRYMRQDRCQAPVDSRVAEPPRPPMDLANMAAVLEKIGIECRIKDYPMEGGGWEKTEADLSEFMPELLVISTTTPTINNDLMACDLAKRINPRIKTIAKGSHFLVYDKEILAGFKNLDVAIRGEPEITVKELTSEKDYSRVSGITFRKDSRIIRNPDRPFLENLDELPLPARHLLNNSLYRCPDTNQPIAFITASRGCPGRCIFCAAGMVSGYKIRLRSVESVLMEIEECVSKFGIRNFFFSADTFTWQKPWLIRLCEGIVNKGLKIRWGANSRVDTLDEERVIWMKKAGCYVIGFGAESASQLILDKMKKDISVGEIKNVARLCNKYKIESFLHFVIGLPWDTKETIEETLGFVKKTQASFVEVNIAYPIPGTEFFNIAKENGLFDENFLAGHDHTKALVRSTSLSTSELIKLRKEILLAFYIRASYIIKTVGRLNSPNMALNYCKYSLRLINNLLKT